MKASRMRNVGVSRIVDSYLVRDGSVVGLNLHESRFTRMACAAGARREKIAEFLRGVRHEIPSSGQWFPKLCYVPETDDCSLELRPAPPLRNTTTVWVPPREDARTAPAMKGPDLPALGRLREKAQAQGADDALLHHSGEVIELAHASLVFFHPDGEVIIPGAGYPTLESVTLKATAELLGWKDACRRPVSLQEAMSAKLCAWAGSSLHGWTPVSAWISDDTKRTVQAASLTNAPQAAAVNAKLWETSQSLARC